MFCQGFFNWQGRVGWLVRVGLWLELVRVRVRVRNKVKDIGSGLGFGLMTGLLAHLVKILQIFRNFNSEN